MTIELLKSCFDDKSGIEVGGPSAVFGAELPIYQMVRQLDGCNFSAQTVWEGSIEAGGKYRYFGDKAGTQYVSEASDLSAIPDEHYDFLISSHCLEHCANTLKVVEEWLRVVKTGGAVLMILPEKSATFDHRRPVTTFDHLLSDYQNNVDETDLTHFEEIMTLHDLALDPGAGTFNQFKARSLDNFNNRCFHQHVFDFDLLEKIYRYFNIKIVGKALTPPYHQIIVGIKQTVPARTSIAWQDQAAPVRDKFDYAEWVSRFDTIGKADRESMQAKMGRFASTPLISVLMPVYNAPASFLDQAIESVRNQIYTNWQLCIADDASSNAEVRKVLERHAKQDARIEVVYRNENGHISRASNSALELVRGEFVALLDHDDLMAQHALYWVADTINRHPDAGLIYSDEDKVDESNRRFMPYFKGDLNYELLLAKNTVVHLGVYRTDILRKIQGFRVGFEGAQDYDLALRMIEFLEPHQVVHIPRILYHWRAISGSTALAGSEKNYAAEAGRRAVAAHLERKGVRADVGLLPAHPAFLRVRYACPAPQPLVSIVMPIDERKPFSAEYLHSLADLASYANYDILFTGHADAVTKAKQQAGDALQKRISTVHDDSSSDLPGRINRAARAAKGELLCLMDSRIESLTPGWLEEMVSFAMQPDVGCVAPRLATPDGALQLLNILDSVWAGPHYRHYLVGSTNPGYFGNALLHQSVSAVTATCFLVKKSIFDKVGGFNDTLTLAFSDLDFSLRVRKAGYRNVWTPHAEMRYHGTLSAEIPSDQINRYRNEICEMQAAWGELLLDDPNFNPNLALSEGQLSYAWPPRIEHLAGERQADNPDFSEADYLKLNPDVALAVQKGQFRSGREHYLRFGKQEGRRASSS